MPEVNEKSFIKHILNAIQAVTAGDLSTVIESSGTFPELDAMAEAINKLNAEIRKNADKLKERQILLENSNAQTETILRSLQTGIFIIDESRHLILDVNQMGEELIGLPKELIIGKKCHQFICPKEEGQCPISDLGMTINNEETVLITGNGNNIPVMKRVIGIEYQGSKCLLDSVVDISKVKEKDKKVVI
jgi:PAS domain S-box-containing protein